MVAAYILYIGYRVAIYNTSWPRPHDSGYVNLYIDHSPQDVAISTTEWAGNDLSSIDVELSAYGRKPTKPIKVLGVVVGDPIDFFKASDTPYFKVLYDGPPTREDHVRQVFVLSLTDDFLTCDDDCGSEIRQAAKERNFGRASWGGNFRVQPSRGAGKTRRQFPDIQICDRITGEHNASLSLVEEQWFRRLPEKSWYRPKCQASTLPKGDYLNEFRYGGSDYGDDSTITNYSVISSYPRLSPVDQNDVLSNDTIGFNDNGDDVLTAVDIVVASQLDQSRSSLWLVMSGLLFGIGGSILAAVLIDAIRLIVWLPVDPE